MTEVISNLSPSKIENLGRLIEYGEISPKLLHVADTNNRTVEIPENERAEMDNSVLTEGIIDPIVINVDNGIVQGQLRWKSALRLDLKTVPFIRMEFKDKYSERIASMAQDELHHKLESLDKYLFVTKCLAEDGKTYQSIADSLGKHVETIRAWANFQNVPKVIKDNKKAVDKFMDLTGKKRQAVRSVLDRPAYVNDISKSLAFIEFAGDAPIRDLEQAKKDAGLGSPIDADARKQRLQERTILIEIKIPKHLDKSFREKLKKNNEDYVIVLEQLITAYVRS
jgi:ParB/RepB/Spo0J family partition protein